MKNTKSISILFVMLVIFGSLMLMVPGVTEAGIYNAGNDVTYKEYWVPHTEFTGGCNPDGTPTSPSGSWYMEPHTLAKCPKTVEFTLPDDFTNAAKIEVYLDLWRNYNTQAATFIVNDDDIVYHPPVGSDWSRTPYVLEIDKSEFNVGMNTMTFWGDKRYHVHDIGIRIYYNGGAPLLPGPGSDVEPPNGQLTSIEDDNGPVNPNAGGTLTVNGDQLKLTADISPDTAYVEFHAWYEGYDEDNDGNFRDWHNSGRNNWWPGGKEEQPTGGVINHIGTVKPKAGATTATFTWNNAHITNQARIKFKIRVVDAAGNVREAAGGESANFKMMRAAPVNAFIIHDFTDYGLHMDGSRPDSVTYNFTMPDTVVSDFTTAYLIGAYWRNPNFSINSNAPSTVSSPDWALGIKSFNKNQMVAGNNKITYLYTNGAGAFIEKPGPMFVLRRGNAVADNTPPVVSQQNPASNATSVDIKSPIVAHVGDTIFGVDWTTVVMTVNGENVTSKARLEGVMGDYRLVYRPAGGKLEFSTEYNVAIEACDLVGNCMPTATYKFNTADPDTTPPVIQNITVSEMPIGANISWTTNEPATTRIEYGKTAGYGQFIEDLALKTSHSAQIRDLQPMTLYHFKIMATDEQNNTGSSPDQTFTTLDFGELFSDDFNSCQLNDGVWTAVNTDNIGLFMNGEQIELDVPGGTSHDWDSPGGPPRLMQTSSNDDFAVEVKFDSPISIEGQSQGIILEEDSDTFARFSFERTVAKGPILFARFMDDGAVVKTVNTTLPLTDSPSFMRVTRTGDVWKWYYSTDGATWTQISGTHTVSMNVVRAGFFAGNSGSGGTQPAHKAVVDYFFNSNIPIVPEDGAPMSVNINQIGTGTVTKQPDKAKYICGEEVLLSASTIPGWTFEGWDGDVISTAPTASVTIDAPKNVTATFTQDQYTLDVDIVNIGVAGVGNEVTLSPEQATYVYGDEVVLTAVANSESFFSGWSGDVTSTENPLTITMQSHTSVVATFTDNPPPVLDPIADKEVTLGQLLTFQVKATDANGDPVTLTAEDLPPGAEFTDNQDGTGVFSWPTELNQAGEYEITFVATDGTSQTSVTVKISVVGNAIVMPVILR